MPIQPPAGDSAVERTISFLEMYQSKVMQYTYPPGQDWSDHENFVQVELATADILTLLQQHQQMALLLLQVKEYIHDEQALRIMKDYYQKLGKVQQ
jgi:hypothetical protein